MKTFGELFEFVKLGSGETPPAPPGEKDRGEEGPKNPVFSVKKVKDSYHVLATHEHMLSDEPIHPDATHLIVKGNHGKFGSFKWSGKTKPKTVIDAFTRKGEHEDDVRHRMVF